MPINFEMTDNHLRVIAQGPLTAQEFNAAFKDIAESDDYDCEASQLWVFSALNFESFTPRHVVSLGQQLEAKGNTPPDVAFVATDDLTYGMCNVYKGWADPGAVCLEVFRTVDEGVAWLARAEDSQSDAVIK